MTAQKNFLTESFITALAIKAPVRSFATTNVTLSGEQTVNSVALTAGDRVLLTAQTDPLENGVWDVQISAWNRSADFDGSRDVVGGTIVPAYRASDQEIVLYNVDGAPTALIPGTDTINFSVYFDPTMLGGGENLQQTVDLGNTSTTDIQMITGAQIDLFSPDDNDFVFMRVVEPGAFPYLEIGQTAVTDIEEVRFWHDINLPLSDIYIGGIGSRRLAFYARGDAVENSISCDSTSQDMDITVLGELDVLTADNIDFQYTQAASQFIVRDSDNDVRFTVFQAGLAGITTIWTDSGTEFRISDQIGNFCSIEMTSSGLQHSFTGGQRFQFNTGCEIRMLEKASSETAFATFGSYWVRDDAPCVPMFTDDDGTDQVIDPALSEVNVQNGNYTLVASDKGKTISKESGGAGETYTIPANASVAFAIGTFVAFNNDGGGDLDIAITTDTLIWADDGTTGTRTLADGGYAVAQKVAATTWKIAGKQLS